MNFKFRHIFTLLVFFLSTTTAALAYNPYIYDVTIPYEPYIIETDIDTRTEFLGKLVGDPQMYEFTTGATTTLKVSLSQLSSQTPIPFSLIVIKQNEKDDGVSEVGRLLAKDIILNELEDSTLGLSLVQSQSFAAEISPGVYRVEVSTPDNFGSYLLTIGELPRSVDYFKTLSDIHTIQSFFGKSVFALFISSHVYYPLGIIILLGLIFLTWKYRQKIQTKTV